LQIPEGALYAGQSAQKIKLYDLHKKIKISAICMQKVVCTHMQKTTAHMQNTEPTCTRSVIMCTFHYYIYIHLKFEHTVYGAKVVARWREILALGHSVMESHCIIGSFASIASSLLLAQEWSYKKRLVGISIYR